MQQVLTEHEEEYMMGSTSTHQPYESAYDNKRKIFQNQMRKLYKKRKVTQIPGSEAPKFANLSQMSNRKHKMKYRRIKE